MDIVGQDEANMGIMFFKCEFTKRKILNDNPYGLWIKQNHEGCSQMAIVREQKQGGQGPRGETRLSSWRLLLLLSRFSRVRLCATPWTAAHHAPPSLGLYRQEQWRGLPFPSPMHESEK